MPQSGTNLIKVHLHQAILYFTMGILDRNDARCNNVTELSEYSEINIETLL